MTGVAVYTFYTILDLIYLCFYNFFNILLRRFFITITSQDGKFEWDSDKDELNIKNHGFSFSEILEVFDDPYLLTKYDEKHSKIDEDRYFSVGSIRGIVIIAVSHTDKNGRTRIISARKAEPKLKEFYNAYIKQINR